MIGADPTRLALRAGIRVVVMIPCCTRHAARILRAMCVASLRPVCARAAAGADQLAAVGTVANDPEVIK